MLPRSVILVLIAGMLALIGSVPAGSGTEIARGFQQQSPTEAGADASPVSLDQIAPYPEGITLTALALAPVDQMPANPATVRLERYTLAGAESLSGASAGPRLVVVESGELLLDSPDLPRGALGPTQYTLIPAGATASLRPVSAGVTFLHLLVEPDRAEPDSLTSPVSPRLLLNGSPRLPRGEGTLSIIRVSVEASADAGQRVFSGPVGLAVESGTLTVVDLDGQPAQLEPGGSLFAPAYTAHHLRNDGTEAVSGLAVAILPTSPALAGAPVASPTPATDVAATATVESLLQTETNLLATIAAQDADREGNLARVATAEAQSAVEVSSAQATMAAIAVDAFAQSHDLATANAGVVLAQGTITGLQPTIAAQADTLSTATAREASLLATSQAHEIALTAQATEVASLSSRMVDAEDQANQARELADQAEATNSEQARTLQTVVGTATAQAQQSAAARGTIEAQLAAAQGNVASLSAAEASRTAELGAAQQTVTAQGAELATFAAATSPAIDPNYREVMIESDVSGVVQGSQQAQAAIVAAVREALAAELDLGCQAALVLTFGYNADVNSGVDFAGAVNNALVVGIPEMFDNADTENFAGTVPPFGRAQIRIYLTTACNQAVASGQTPILDREPVADQATAIGPSTPTSPPIVPTS